MSHHDHLLDDWPELPLEAGNSDHHPFEPNDAWLKDAPEALQLEAMRRWFHARYEDPANQTPYSSHEGGYLFIHGGPYDPNDVIQKRFEGIVQNCVMEKLISDLWTEIGQQWAPIEDEGRDYGEELSISLERRTDPRSFLDNRLDQIKSVIAVQASPVEKDLIHQMAHSALITSLEAYLADTVIYWVRHDKSAMRKFVSGNKDFKARTLTLNQVFDRLEKLDHEIQEYLQSLIWHRLDKIKPMIQVGFDIQLPDIDDLMRQVVVRHDIVHRAGRTSDGRMVSITDEDVCNLHDAVRKFSNALEGELLRRFPA